MPLRDAQGTTPRTRISCILYAFCAVRLALTPGRFWDEQCFRDNFSTWFDFESFVQQEEPESVSLAKQTFITIALARKKVPL